MASGNGKNGSVSMVPGITLMDLDVGVWAAQVKLTAEDLGLTPDQIPEDFYLGHRAIIPKKILKEVRRYEGRGRRVLRKYGFRFPIGQTQAVPEGAVAEAEAELLDLQTQFKARTQTFITEEYPILRESYLAKNGEHLRKYFPSAADLSARFQFEWVTIQVSVPTGNEENAAKVRARVEGWVDEIAVEFRNAASTIFATLAERIKNEQWGAVSDKRFAYLRAAIDRLRWINFLNIPEVEENLMRAKDLLSSTSAEAVRTDATVAEQVRTALNGIVEGITKADLEEVTSTYKRKLRL